MHPAHVSLSGPGWLLGKWIAACFCVAFLFSANPASSQTHLHFHLIAGEFPIQADSEYILMPRGEKLRINEWKFYISSVELLNEDKVVWKENDSYHLIDLRKPESQVLYLKTPQDLRFNTLRFTLGIDSLTNETGVKPGDLDPVLGMYWAWQSGYINFKLEGISPASASKKNEFEFHLGGFLGPWQTARTVSLDVNNTKEIAIQADVLRFLGSIDLSKEHHLMSPGQRAAELSTKAAGIFIVQ